MAEIENDECSFMDLFDIATDVEEFISTRERLVGHINRIRADIMQCRAESKEFYDLYKTATDGKNAVYLEFHQKWETQLEISLKALANAEEAVLGLERRVAQLRS